MTHGAKGRAAKAAEQAGVCFCLSVAQFSVKDCIFLHRNIQIV